MRKSPYKLRFEKCTGIIQGKRKKEELSRRKTGRVQVSGNFGGGVLEEVQ